MMRQVMTTLTACLFCAGIGNARAADYNFKPGLWETTTTIKMKNMPAGMPAMPGMKPHTERHCIRKSDTEFVPNPGGPKNQCKVSHTRVSRNKLRWTVRCNNQGIVSEGHGEVTYSGTKSHGYFEMTMKGGPGGPMVMRHTFTSRRIGDCK